MLIGIDFDNTIAGYDGLFASLAVEHAYLGPAASTFGKKAVRDALRAQPDGDIAWQRLQALAYGSRMAGAEVNPGFADFVTACRGAHIPLSIVSHKTRHSPVDPDGPDLRAAAMQWMEVKGFFSSDGFGFARADVQFADTREAKIAKIVELGCTHFIDDLEEVFAERAFPAGVTGILFGAADALTRQALVQCRDWYGVTAHLLQTSGRRAAAGGA